MLGCRPDPTPEPDEAMAADGHTTDRIGYAVVSMASIAVLVAARLLEPSPSGHGTHEQLGLPPCTFHLLTGHKCPGCGMTTSFAHLARGELSHAFAANPFGPLLFAIAALLASAAALLALRPRPVEEVLRNRLVLYAPVTIFAGMVLVWIVRLALGGV